MKGLKNRPELHNDSTGSRHRKSNHFSSRTPDNRDSFHHRPTFQRRNRFHFKDSGVAVEPVCPRFFTRMCPALFPPPRFGTLSKIQKGGEPVPQPVEERWCLRRSAYKWNGHLTCLHVCCAASCACVRAYLCHPLKTRCTVAMASHCVHLSCLTSGYTEGI